MSTKKKWFRFLCVILVLMTVFSVTDLFISERLFNINSKFGKFFEIYAAVPNMLFGTLSMWVLLCADYNKGNYLKPICYTVVCLFICGIATYVPLHYMGYSAFSSVHIIVWIVYAIATFFLVNSFRIEDRHNFIRVAIIGIIVFVAVPVIIEIIKIIWGRVRFREMSEPFSMFSRWFVPQFGRYRSIYSDPSSFPSGHTANATVIFMFMFLSELFPELRSKRVLFFVLSCIWVLCTGIGRIIMGAHFASDVTFGAVVVIVIIEVTAHYVNKKMGYTKVLSLLP